MVCFQPPTLLIRKVWVPVMHVMRVPYTADCIGERAGARIVQIYFSAAFDRVNHQGIVYKLCSAGIGGSVLSILTQFLSNRSQYVMVDGRWRKLVNVVLGVAHGSVWARYCSSCILWSFFPFWKISRSVMLMTPL